jgi:predicted PurR-regulated permease PerM
VSNQRESFLPPLWILSSAAVVLSIWIIISLKELVVLFLLGYFIAYAIDPLVTRLERRGISRALAFFAVCGSVALLLVVGLVTAFPAIVDEFHKLSDNLQSYVQTGRNKLVPNLERLQGWLPESLRSSLDFHDINSVVSGLMGQVSGDTINNVGRAVLETLLKGYNRVLTIVNIALLPFIVFYISVDLPVIHRFFLSAFPTTRRSKVKHIFGEIDGYVSAFVRGQALVCCVLFALYAVGLGALRVDLWFLLAFIAGFGNMIPYVGTISGIVLSCLMALVTFGDVSHLLWVLGVFAVVQFLEGMVITPRIMGESVGLSPLVIILALFAGGQLFGLLGIFLAVPTAATLRVLVRHSYRWALHS